MIKVLIYSSKEIYDNSSYEGRAEADIVAYRINAIEYYVVKNRYPSNWLDTSNNVIATWALRRHVEKLEREQWYREIAAYKLQENNEERTLM